MQNRYVGDIGDFAKYSLLNALSAGKKLGVAWYLYPDEGHNADGKHITYLSKPTLWRNKDTVVFDGLKLLIDTNDRSTKAVISSEILHTHNVASEVLDNESASHLVRKVWRHSWFQETMRKLGSSDFVFADPDNGLCLDKDFRICNKKQWKRLPLREANALSEGRPAVFYHHNTRRKGGHDAEILYWRGQLNGASFAIKFSAYSARTFFVVNATEHMENIARNWCHKFGNRAKFYTL